jgi:hypothetical protein
MAQIERVTTWPARYKASTLEIHESLRHQIWIASAEVRKALPALRSDKILTKEYSTDFRKLDSTSRLFFSERTLKRELQRMGGRDTLMFLAWLDKTVYYPAARKRGDSHASPPMPEKPSQADEKVNEDEDLHIPVRKLPPPAKPKRVHPLTTGQRKKPSEQARSLRFVRLWRGQFDLLPTLLWGGGAMLVWTLLVWALLLWAIDPGSYRGAFAARQWLVVFLVPAIPSGVIWWCVGVMRSALRSQHEGRGYILALGSFSMCAAILLNATWFSRGIAQEWLSGWIETVFDNVQVSEVIHDKFLGRIVVKGDIGWGSYKALEEALRIKPKLTLIEVQGPGGYVVEGLAMARLIQENHLDTVTLGECASACTFLLAAGKERYLGADAKVGFHRSGRDYNNVSKSWTSADYAIANYYKSRDTTDDFIKQALDTPFNRIWFPAQGQMFTAGYATKRWDERKAGY